MLWLLAALPVLVGAYLLVLRRRKLQMQRFTRLRMVDEAMRGTGRALRHAPAALFFAGIALMLLAAARPEAVLSLPLHEETVILAIDVSGSMRATDIYPDRLSVAQAAAKHFVAAKSASTRVGVVEFAGTALLVQGPSTERRDVVAAIDGLQPRDSTAIGSAIVASLKAIFPKAELDDAPPARPGLPDKSCAIILLTDGENTAGPDPLDAARLAMQYGVRVFTVGLGTEEGEFVASGHTLERVRVDERSLRTIAEMTGGEYFHAESLLELSGVYDKLRSDLTVAARRAELTLVLSVAAALALIAAASPLALLVQPHFLKGNAMKTALVSVLLACVATTAAAAAQNPRERDRAECQRESAEDQAACLREAAAARAEARRGRLDEGLSAEYEKNRLARCGYLPAADRPDCERRMRGEGTTSGSVAGGGIYRELRTFPAPDEDVNRGK